jgi:hypothetical protein
MDQMECIRIMNQDYANIAMELAKVVGINIIIVASHARVI